MLKHTKLRLLVVLAALSVLALIVALWQTPHTTTPSSILPVPGPAFKAYVSAFTGGEISRLSPIRVRFADPIAPAEEIGRAVSQGLFSFEPPIDGQARWEDAYTLRFEPAGMLPAGQRYTATLALDRVLSGVPATLQRFPFGFYTAPPGVAVELTGTQTLRGADQQWQQVSGIVRTSDHVPADQVENLFAVKTDRKPFVLRWLHDETTHTHTFTIDSLERGDDAYEVTLIWDGADLGIELHGEQSLTVPPRGSFRHMHTYTYPDHVVVEFSEPLRSDQDLAGLVRLGDQDQVKTRIEGHRLKIFPPQRLRGSARLFLDAGILSRDAEQLPVPHVETVLFEEIKPEVRIVGKGSIIPRGDKLPLVFEAIGLRAVDVRVIKIFEKNIPQFLQVNQLDGTQELKRVGQVIAMKTLDLGTNTELDLNSWNRHSLDLAPLIDSDPGAIYEVAIAFRRTYALLPCASEEPEAAGAPAADKNLLEVGDAWNVYTQYEDYSYWDWWEYYDYEDFDNPCTPLYYSQRRIVRRNILASDLGLIAKQGDNGAFFAVTDLKTAKPLPGVQLECYDYQHQLVATLTTGQDGTVRTDFARKPHLLVAKQGRQRGYMRLDDGSALSSSRFDTQGRKYYRGVKGFIYAERGVWRPGDEMHVSFMLEDQDKQLPAEHPITFEMFDSRGQLVEKIVRTQGLNGLYTFPAKTAADAPTGNYVAKVHVGGAHFSQTMKVETIIPNRLRMELDFGLPFLSAQTADRGSVLKSQWLHGAIARGLKADVRVALRPAKTSFARYQNFTFDDPVRKFASEEVTLFEGRLDDNGTARIPAKITMEGDAPGALTASFTTRVYEPGGAFSIDRFSIPYYPYLTYVGVRAPKGDVTRSMLLTDTDHKVDIVTVDVNGNPVSSEVTVTLYKLEWRWWWDQSQDNIGIYQGQVNAEELETATLRTANGQGAWTLNVKYPDWGRYLVRVVDKNGHATGQIVYIDWPGWAGRAREGDEGGAQMLNFTADKEVYQVGEEITLNIPTGDAGRALVSIETGTKVLSAYWVDAVKGTTRFSFKATGDMAPNIYAYITLLQPHAQTANDLPIRMYGILPIKVEDPQTHLAPQISMADELKPNSKVDIQVSEATGKPMTYTVAVVDEGLLGLTRFQTPDPWQTFYQREALDVKTWDLYDQVLGAYGGEIKSLLSIGGDGEGDGPAGKKADRFKPVVIFLGPFELKAGQRATHQIELPNYVGAVRTMVVAGDMTKGAYGAAEKSTPVRTPLMVLGTLPRVLGPGETVQLPVSVFTMDDKIKTVNVTLSVGGKMLVEGSESQTLTFATQGEKITSFEVGVLSSLGTTPVKIVATGGGQTAVYETDIEIRNPNTRITDVLAGQVEAGATWQQAYKPIGMSGTQTATLEVSSIPPINLAHRLEYLIRYPYGCIEQTTSAAFPQLFLSSLIQLTPQEKEKADKNIRAALARLKRFQTRPGGFAYWPGQPRPSEWGTNYAGHFMLAAEQAGYTLPDGMRSSWLAYQQEQAKAWSGTQSGTQDGEQLTQSYRLYVLALAGAPERGAMNRLRQLPQLDSRAYWHLAAAYYLAGQPEVGRELVRTRSFDVPTYQELSGTYGSEMRDKGIMLEALSVMGDRERGAVLVAELSSHLASKEWCSTHETAYALLGIAKYAGLGNAKAEMKFGYKIAGGNWTDVTVNHPVWQLPMENLRAGTLEFRNQSKVKVYPRMVLSGIPLVGDTTHAANGLNMSVRYLTLDKTERGHQRIAQGTDFMAEVTITNTGRRDYQELALNQVFPSGWEIRNIRMDGLVAQGDAPTFQDIRDDRVYTFFDLTQGQTKTFVLLLNAAYLGRYYLPAHSVEAMYDHTINARRAGGWVEIIEDTSGG
ncbi:MAG: MG2 domain-containing protein [Bacteroidia bacterium]